MRALFRSFPRKRETNGARKALGPRLRGDERVGVSAIFL